MRLELVMLLLLLLRRPVLSSSPPVGHRREGEAGGLRGVGVAAGEEDYSAKKKHRRFLQTTRVRVYYALIFS